MRSLCAQAMLLKGMIPKQKIMKVLFIGGTGIISSACSQLAVERGIELFHFNRGMSRSTRSVDGVKLLKGDIRDKKSSLQIIKEHEFDCVVDWVAFTPDHIEADIELFLGRTKQFIFISSASAYQTPPEKLPISESTPLNNPFWEYSRDKIACEQLLKKAYVEKGFPYTIVRPSHTYDKTLLPFEGGVTVLHRILNGKPIVMFGDGSSVWTITHHRDFAKGLVGLIGNSKAIAEDFHITTDELLTWENIYTIVAEVLGKTLSKVYVASEKFATYHKAMGDSVLGDKMHSMVFDNSKIKATVPDFACTIPFRDGIQEVLAWHLARMEELAIDPELDAVFDRIVADKKIGCVSQIGIPKSQG